MSGGEASSGIGQWNWSIMGTTTKQQTKALTQKPNKKGSHQQPFNVIPVMGSKQFVKNYTKKKKQPTMTRKNGENEVGKNKRRERTNRKCDYNKFSWVSCYCYIGHVMHVQECTKLAFLKVISASGVHTWLSLKANVPTVGKSLAWNVKARLSNLVNLFQGFFFHSSIPYNSSGTQTWIINFSFMVNFQTVGFSANWKEKTLPIRQYQIWVLD